MAQEWYRSPDSSADAMAEFERRLARARPGSRSQYLKIKAIALSDAGADDVAEQMLRRVLDQDVPDFERAHAEELLGDMARRRGDLTEAERRYRQILGRPSQNGTSGQVPLALAEVLLERDGAGAADEVGSLLATVGTSPRFNSEIFRALVLSARTARAVGDTSLQAVEARRALDLLGEPSQLPRHPGVGLAQADDQLLAELQMLAEAGP
jgi:tetratricopeptide (TPR) repeat protein